jgi:hypothetical protein
MLLDKNVPLICKRQRDGGLFTTGLREHRGSCCHEQSVELRKALRDVESGNGKPH